MSKDSEACARPCVCPPPPPRPSVLFLCTYAGDKMCKAKPRAGLSEDARSHSSWGLLTTRSTAWLPRTAWVLRFSDVGERQASGQTDTRPSWGTAMTWQGLQGRGLPGEADPRAGPEEVGEGEAFPLAAVTPGDTPLQLIPAEGPPPPPPQCLAADQLTPEQPHPASPSGSRPTLPACDSGQTQWHGDAMGWGWVFGGELRGRSKRLEGGRRGTQ